MSSSRSPASSLLLVCYGFPPNSVGVGSSFIDLLRAAGAGTGACVCGVGPPMVGIEDFLSFFTTTFCSRGIAGAAGF